MKYTKIHYLTLKEFEGFKQNIPYSENLYELEVKQVEGEGFIDIRKQCTPFKGLEDFSFSYASIRVFLVEGIGVVYYIPIHKYELLKLPANNYPLDKTILLESKNVDTNFNSIRNRCKKHILYSVKVEIEENDKVKSLGTFLFGLPQQRSNIDIKYVEEGYLISFPAVVPYIEQLLREVLGSE